MKTQKMRDQKAPRNEADVASWDERQLFKYLKRIKAIDKSAKYEVWKHKKTEMLSIIYNELQEVDA